MLKIWRFGAHWLHRCIAIIVWEVPFGGDDEEEEEERGGYPAHGEEELRMEIPRW